jgi:hypothetical protein
MTNMPPDTDGASYLTMDGSPCRRLVVAYANDGKVITRGMTIRVGELMAQRLLRTRVLDPRINEDVPVFRVATLEERVRYWKDKDVRNVALVSDSALAAAAREEAINMGIAGQETADSVKQQQALAKQRNSARAAKP